MTILDLRADFSRFRGAAPKRINLAAHSHHEWPEGSSRNMGLPKQLRQFARAPPFLAMIDCPLDYGDAVW